MKMEKKEKRYWKNGEWTDGKRGSTNMVENKEVK